MRQILHLDLDAFFASVEVLQNPELEGKPLIVAMGSLNGRGVVATASYPARRFGVHSAMPLREAVRLCPQAVIVPVRHDLYSQYSTRVMAILREVSPLVEQVSIDEAYVEIPLDRECPAAECAREVQRRIKTEIGLDATIALAANKLVSKVACNTVKPRGFIIIPPGSEQTFLGPLPIEKLPGAGKVTRAKLARWKVKTIGDLARVPVAELRRVLGQYGVSLHEAALGHDDSPLVTESKPQSLSEENTFDRDTRDLKQILEYLEEMSQGVARALEQQGYLARTVVLKLRYGDFKTLTRQTTLRTPTSSASEIYACARQLLESHWDRRRALRLVGVGVHNLVDPSGTRQLEFAVD